VPRSATHRSPSSASSPPCSTSAVGCSWCDGRTAESGRTGCLEPGEQPAAGAVREVREEAAVEVAVERLLSVEALDLSVAPNGDQVYWHAIGMRCRLVSGEVRVNDDESVAVAWFEPDAVPALPPHQARCLALALAPDAEPWFLR